MYIALTILLGLWLLSRLTDAFSCSILAFSIKKKNDKSFFESYKLFVALAIDSFVTAGLIAIIMPYLVLGWAPPPVWVLPWVACIAMLSTSFKTYTKFKVAYVILTTKGH